LIIGGRGILGFATTVYQTRQKSSTDTAHSAAEAAAQESADWGAFTDRIQKYMDYQDQQINSLRAEIESLKKERQADIAYVDLLNYWIWKRLSPPPPKRGDGYTDEDQVGGQQNTRLSRAIPLRWRHSFKELLPCRTILQHLS